MFYRARYYDPKVGRFISEDPIGFEGGDLNVYRYVFNSSQILTDPTGQSPFIEYATLRGGLVGAVPGVINFIITGDVCSSIIFAAGGGIAGVALASTEGAFVAGTSIFTKLAVDVYLVSQISFLTTVADKIACDQYFD